MCLLWQEEGVEHWLLMMVSQVLIIDTKVYLHWNRTPILIDW